MPRLMAKFVVFLRWLSAPEELPSAVAAKADAADGHASKPTGFLWSILSDETLASVEPGPAGPASHPPSFWPWILGGGELPVADPADSDRPSRTAFLIRLLASETCPTHPAGAIEHRERVIRRVLAPERCPVAPAWASAGKKGFARWILEQEECPVDSASAPVRGRGFWRNLFASEEL